MHHPTPEEVKALRTEAGLTQNAFAEIARASPAALQSWEQGRKACPVNTWEVLLVYFGKVPPRQLKRPRDEAGKLAHDLEAARAEVSRLQALIHSIHNLTTP